VHHRPLYGAYFGLESVNGNGTDNTTLVIAGIHGDEMQGVFMARSLIDLLREQPDMFVAPGGRLAGARVVIVPLVNPDGAVAHRRRNAHLVDLNRNFPASNWVPTLRKDRYHGGLEPASEPETLAVIQLIHRTRPNKIIAIHAIEGGAECNNFDGPAEGLAELMSSHNGYPVEPNIGYATPGSLGTWAGIEKRIATLTLELPDRRSAPYCWNANREALLAALAYRCPPPW
jgi:protein MpaA